MNSQFVAMSYKISITLLQNVLLVSSPPFPSGNSGFTSKILAFKISLDLPWVGVDIFWNCTVIIISSKNTDLMHVRGKPNN